MPRQSDARSRAVATTAELLQRQGYAATGLTEVIDRSGAPKGSFYFHFPDGKEQLAAEAVIEAGKAVLGVMEEVRADTDTPASFLRKFAAREARKLANSHYELGCPVATITLEMASRSPTIRRAAAQAYARWTDLLSDVLSETKDPLDFAVFVLATLEGALLLARAWQNTRPIVDAAERLATLAEASRAKARSSRRL